MCSRTSPNTHFQEAIGIVTHKMERNWHLSGALFEELRFNPLGDQIMKAQVVECPDEFVRASLRIRTWRNKDGHAEKFQAINMKNPISGMSISEDRGRTWWAMSHWGGTDMFLRPPVLTKENNLLVRVESWMGGSSVFVSSGPDLIWSPDSLSGNNVCRGIFKFRVSEK